ncbi:multi-sensor hybrid histidine kinase [Calothrix sp. NIES-4101]|nr:multi-sensor hybrid histidine kinase [Calothrix sp. NIES-4101]
MQQPSRTILIVDDSSEERELYRRYLLQDPDYAYRILEVSLGHQGLELWQQQQPDLVLLNYRLLDLDVLEFLAQLPSPTPQPCLPVIIMTDQGNEAIAIQAIKAGAQDYLIKGQITPERLHLTIYRAIETVHIRTELYQRIEREHVVNLRQADLERESQTELECQLLEAELHQSEERLRSALIASRMGTWDWNIETGCIQWSDNLEAMFGLQPGAFDGSFQMFSERLHPDDRDRVLAEIERVITTGEDYTIEFRVVYPDGTIRWALSQGKVFYDSQGQPVRMMGNDIDITDRKQAEEALQVSEERFRQLAENIDAAFWMREVSENRISYLSSAYERLWGLNPQELYENQQAWINYIHPDDREATDRAFWEKARLRQFDQEYRIILPDGRTRWVRDRCFPIQNQSGEIYRFTGIAEDITDRKQIEAALWASHDTFRHLVENSPFGVYVVDADFRLFQISNGAKKVFANVRPLIGRDFAEVLHILWPEPFASEAIAHFRHTLATGKPYHAASMVERRHDTDQVESYDWKIERIMLPDGRFGVVCHFYDLSGRQQLLQREQAARAEAERANRIKDEFLAVLSHELRSPLNPILGWTQLMQSRKFPPSKTAEALATIERNAKLQTQLIDDLLDIAKILRGKLSMNVAPVDLAFVIEAAIDTVRTAAVTKDILLRSVLPQIGQVSGDATRLQQIIWNLLANAIKFTPAKGQVEIHLEREGNQAKITVSDTGKGINPNFLPHLFESFRQEDASTTRQYGGLGLGLAIVRHLVEAHGGTICADSPGEGQGTTFIVKFPLLDAASEQPTSEAVAINKLDLTGMRILAVDDEPDARELLMVLLTQYGAEVLTVTSATEVLANLELFQPDVLISDIGMPEVDGYVLMQQIRALPPEKGGRILAIALTAYARIEDYQQAIASGYQRYLTKPLDLDQLVKVVVELFHCDTFS